MKTAHLMLAGWLILVTGFSYDNPAFGQASGDTPGNKPYPDYTVCIPQDWWNACRSQCG